MNCHETRKYLSAFLDSELDVRTNIEVLEHVEMCPRCAARLDEQARLKKMVAGCLDSARAPLALRMRISARLEDAGAGGRVKATVRDFAGRGWVRTITAAATILIVFTMVYKVLLAPPAALSAGAMQEHVAMLRDRLPAFRYTTDAERASRFALFRMGEKPPIPLMDAEKFQLVGAGPCEIGLMNVGHFAFRYKAETVSMFVFDGRGADEFAGRRVITRFGEAKLDSRGEINLLSWQTSRFTYVLVSRLPAEELLGCVASERQPL